MYKFGVIVFPGSNCDDDMIHVLSDVCGHEAVKIWHKEYDLAKYGSLDGLFIPGGFSYGDYLRCGAIARFSHIMPAVNEFANQGGFVMGICNGFQILCEAGLLPGVLLRNERQKFVCKNTYLRVENNTTMLSNQYAENEVIKIPVAHAEGRYYADSATIASLEKNKQVVFRYCDENGQLSEKSNFNGSLNSIAGICNENGNVFGMMPHPERASEDALGNTDGRRMFQSIIASISQSVLS